MAGSFSSLPPELLDRICDFIQAKRDIASFFQCSRLLYAVAAPHLYRHVDLLSTEGSTPFSHSLHVQSDTASHRIDALVQAFLRDPALGTMVRSLAIRLPELKYKDKNATKPLEDGCASMVKAILGDDLDTSARPLPSGRPAPVPESDDDDDDGNDSGSEWGSVDEESADEDELKVYNPEKSLPVFDTEADRWVWLAARSHAIRGNIMFTILLSRLANVERLDLEMPTVTGWRTGFLDRAIQKSQTDSVSSSSPSLLANLRRVCFGYTSPQVRGESWVGPFILPGVEEVYLHHLFGLGPSLSLVKPNTLNITHLELRDCRVAPHSLVHLLRSPRALKTFIYIVGEVQTRAEHFLPISYLSLRLALEFQKDSLEQIWLDYPHDYHWDESSNEHTSPMGSLSGFTKLKHLRIAGTYLFGFVWSTELDPRRLLQALPEQIETLRIAHADEDDETIEGVSFILDAKKQGRLGRLRELSLEASFPWYNEKSRDLMEIIDTAKTVNMTVRIFNNHSDTRIEDLWDRRRAAMTITQSASHHRRESPWGFNGETTWPLRVNGCMQIPVYEDISEMWTVNPTTA